MNEQFNPQEKKDLINNPNPVKFFRNALMTALVSLGIGTATINKVEAQGRPLTETSREKRAFSFDNPELDPESFVEWKENFGSMFPSGKHYLEVGGHELMVSNLKNRIISQKESLINGDAHLVISAGADERTPPAEYENNRDLAEKRAETVKNVLEKIMKENGFTESEVGLILSNLQIYIPENDGVEDDKAMEKLFPGFRSFQKEKQQNLKRYLRVLLIREAPKMEIESGTTIQVDISGSMLLHVEALLNNIRERISSDPNFTATIQPYLNDLVIESDSTPGEKTFSSKNKHELETYLDEIRNYISNRASENIQDQERPLLVAYKQMLTLKREFESTGNSDLGQIINLGNEGFSLRDLENENLNKIIQYKVGGKKLGDYVIFNQIDPHGEMFTISATKLADFYLKYTSYDGDYFPVYNQRGELLLIDKDIFYKIKPYLSACYFNGQIVIAIQPSSAANSIVSSYSSGGGVTNPTNSQLAQYKNLLLSFNQEEK